MMHGVETMVRSEVESMLLHGLPQAELEVGRAGAGWKERLHPRQKQGGRGRAVMAGGEAGGRGGGTLCGMFGWS
jgi:hypothetical protein